MVIGGSLQPNSFSPSNDPRPKIDNFGEEESEQEREKESAAKQKNNLCKQRRSIFFLTVIVLGVDFLFLLSFYSFSANLKDKQAIRE